MKKRRTNISQIRSKSLSSVKDRDLKLLAKSECTSLSLDLLNKQLSTISINITVIISFCMVYKCLCNPNSKQDSTPLMQKKKINDVAMWQSQRYVFIVSSTLFSLYLLFWFGGGFQPRMIVMSHLSLEFKSLTIKAKWWLVSMCFTNSM